MPWPARGRRRPDLPGQGADRHQPRRPGLDQAPAAVGAGDTLVGPKRHRLARPVPDARDIGDSLVARGGRLCLGGTSDDPADPMGKRCFNLRATFAGFELGLLRLRTRQGVAIARAKGKPGGTPPKLTPRQQRELVRRHDTGGCSIAERGGLFTVSRATVSRATVSRATVCRVLERHRITNAAAGQPTAP